MINRMVLNETSYFGRGSREKLGEELIERKYKRILLVTDYNLMNDNVTKMVIDILDKKEISYIVYMHVKPNPTISNVLEGLHLAEISNVDAIVAVGGGSVIDTAKAISIILTNPEFKDVVSLDGIVKTENKGLPLFALPTTAGTAAETTINYVITDENNKRKMVCVDVHDIPVCAIIDPDLMQRMPKHLAATSGMDALTHALEGYITKSAWLIPDMFHINAMALIYKNLYSAAIEKNEVAIEKMAYAQYIAGMGFSNVGLGIVHSMAHSLGAYYDMPHGLANAILLPHIMKFNGAICPELFVNIANAFGLDINGQVESEVVDTVVNAIKELSLKLEIPQSLKEVGVTEDLIPEMAKQALNDICTTGNPRNVTEEDLKNLYLKAY